MQKPLSILVIDDEPLTLQLFVENLKMEGYDVLLVSSGTQAVSCARKREFDVVITDLAMPGMSGMDVLSYFTENHPETFVIVVTGYGTIETAVRAMKRGAFDYLSKPANLDELLFTLRRAREIKELKDENLRLRSQIQEQHRFDKIIGRSQAMQILYGIIRRVAGTHSTVLIMGESGTGKELIANAIHYHSERRDMTFVPINCGAIPEELLESELFGHEKGSFTGAIASKKGKFELAGDGTIFLDEVSEIPFELQAKLLRFLQEKEFEHVGGEKNLKSNARVIAATNKDLKEMVKNGSFREDLYYRLSVAAIDVPPLRERRSDIPLLIEYIIRKINAELHRSIKRVEEKAVHRLMNYDWPGNVRELENILTRAAITTQGEVILDEFISPLLGREDKAAAGKGALNILSLQEIEKEHILKVLSHARWHLGNSCKLLGISRPTLRQKLKEYGISIHPYSP